MNQIKELTKTLHLNYDMPKEFAEGLAEFLYDEGYRLVSEESQPKTATRVLHVGHRHYCSNCGRLAVMDNYCSNCGAKVIEKED